MFRRAFKSAKSRLNFDRVDFLLIIIIHLAWQNFPLFQVCMIINIFHSVGEVNLELSNVVKLHDLHTDICSIGELALSIVVLENGLYIGVVVLYHAVDGRVVRANHFVNHDVTFESQEAHKIVFLVLCHHAYSFNHEASLDELSCI